MQVNGYFKKHKLIILGVFSSLFIILLLVTFGRLAFKPKQTISPALPQVERGSIVDRNGKPLAVQTNFYHFGVTPSSIKPELIDTFALDVAPVLEMTNTEIAQHIRDASDSSFVYIKKKISSEQYTELKKIIEEKNYTAARFDRIPGRVYPENNLASQLIGYMGNDGVGLSGIEYSEQGELSPPINSND